MFSDASPNSAEKKIRQDVGHTAAEAGGGAAQEGGQHQADLGLSGHRGYKGRTVSSQSLGLTFRFSKLGEVGNFNTRHPPIYSAANRWTLAALGGFVSIWKC